MDKFYELLKKTMEVVREGARRELREYNNCIFDLERGKPTFRIRANPDPVKHRYQSVEVTAMGDLGEILKNARIEFRRVNHTRSAKINYDVRVVCADLEFPVPSELYAPLISQKKRKKR